MPQLIAMVIVVVGAMIYMFQTFGGTGDKIEGIAQKASVITEINNIKNGLQLALRDGEINTATTLTDLATAQYFANQINTEVGDNAGATTPSATADTSGTLNTYSAISFGGENNPGMIINLIPGAVGARPGIRVQFLGNLEQNGGFLETQLANDLRATASVDRTTVDGSAVAIDTNNETPAANRSVNDGSVTPGTVTADTATLTDGILTIYFKDLPRSVVAP